MSSFIEQIISEINQKKDIDLNGYRHDMLMRRIIVRMAKLRLNDRKVYLKKLKEDPTECNRLIDTIGINVSSFFRDPIVFEIIEQNILPSVMANKRHSGQKEIRVWSAGSALGEEAYSMAILIHKALKKEPDNWTPYIFATDIDTSNLKKVKTSLYPRESFISTKVGILDEFFISANNGYEVKSFIKEMVHYSWDNVASPKVIAPAESVFGTFDIVMCRNVLIYFKKELQNKVIEKLYKSIISGGYLILGESESIYTEAKAIFKTIDSKNRIFQKI